MTILKYELKFYSPRIFLHVILPMFQVLVISFYDLSEQPNKKDVHDNLDTI